MPWDDRDRQKKGVAHAMEDFSPSYDEYDARGWREEHILVTSVPGRIEPCLRPGGQVAFVKAF